MSDDGYWRGISWVLLAYLLAFAGGILSARVSGVEGPVYLALIGTCGATMVVFAFSLWFRNSSFYDPYWSVAPPAIVSYWVMWAGEGGDPIRQALIVSLMVAWGYRLTRNWADHWSGLDHEDWRYIDLKEQTGAAYPIVNFLGIHYFPTLIVFACLLPAWVAITSESGFGVADVLAGAVGFTALAIEATADQQLHRWRDNNPRHGAVMQSGLWSYSRHPNYFGELMVWVSLWMFSVAAAPTEFWTIAGCIAMGGMFRFISIPMMETRQLQRRPAYQAYQQRTSMLMPWPSEPVEDHGFAPNYPLNANVGLHTEEPLGDEASVDMPTVTQDGPLWEDD